MSSNDLDNDLDLTSGIRLDHNHKYLLSFMASN